MDIQFFPVSGGRRSGGGFRWSANPDKRPAAAFAAARLRPYFPMDWAVARAAREYRSGSTMSTQRSIVIVEEARSSSLDWL